MSEFTHAKIEEYLDENVRVGPVYTYELGDVISRCEDATGASPTRILEFLLNSPRYMTDTTFNVRRGGNEMRVTRIGK